MNTLEEYINQEAARRLCLLGKTVELADYDYSLLMYRAHQIQVLMKVVTAWWRAYHTKGIDGLKPQWEELSTESLKLALKRKEQLGAHIDDDVLTPEIVEGIGQKNGWHYRTTNRWIERYRVGGLWGLAPGNDHRKRHKPKEMPPRDIGSFDEETLKEIYRRFDMIEGLVKEPSCTEEAVTSQAKEICVCSRTLWNYIAAYRKYGLAGLAPRERIDSDMLHNISERMVRIVRDIRLTFPYITVVEVRTRSCQRAQALGELEPSLYQVRRIISKIPKPVKLLAAGRENTFKGSYLITHKLDHDRLPLIYQIDHNLVDLLAKDIRVKKYRARSGEIRPWHTLLICSAPRLVLGSIFSYDHPNQFTVGAVIRQALLRTPERPYGGIPAETWVDNGKELISMHVYHLAKDVNFELKALPPHQPQVKGVAERFFRMLNTRLWSTLPGYIGSNVQERNPKAKAELTISEIASKYWEFIDQYHHEVHSETGQTPIDYWNEHCFAEEIDPHRLDVFLRRAETRRVLKTGIKYEGRQYWHPDLATLVGQDVQIRGEDMYGAPDEIEVYSEGELICTAYADDTERYWQVSREETVNAKHAQRQHYKQQIDDARKDLEKVDKEIADSNPQEEQGKSDQKNRQHTGETKSANSTKKETGHRPDLLDLASGKGK